MRHLVFGSLLAAYVLVIGQNWAWFGAALMAAAYARHGGRLNARIW